MRWAPPRSRALPLFAAALLSGASAAAQPSVAADPDPAAVEVARLLLTALPRAQSTDAEVTREQQRLEETFLNVRYPDACDRTNADCLAAARAVAREYAPAIVRRLQMQRERELAYGLMGRLSPEQLARLATFFRSADGHVFADAWGALWRPASPEQRRVIECRAQAGLPEPWAEARRSFRERTASLPRTQEKPPAIVMPPSPSPTPCPQ